MDANGDFVVVWESDASQQSTWGLYGDYYYSTGQASGPMVLQSPDTRGTFVGADTFDFHDTGPRVAMSSAGGFVATWATYSSATSDYGVYGEIFARGASPVDSPFLVNETSEVVASGAKIIPDWQLMPAVGVDASGNFTIVWTSYGQDNAEDNNLEALDYGVYAKMYNADGSNFYDTALGTYPLEFRVNATTLGNQVAPVVSRGNASGNSIIAWVGPDTTTGGTAIYLRTVDPPATASAAALPTTPSISVAAATSSVGAAASQITFTVTLSAASSNPVTVNYSTADGTAKAGANYSPTSGTLAFSPQQTSKTVTVAVAGMAAGGLPNQTFLLNLTKPINATLAQTSATATIVDALAAPAPAISVADVSVSVGTTPGKAVFTVTLSNTSSKIIAVGYSTADGTAKVANNAYTATSGTLTFAANQTSASVSVPIAALTASGLANQTFQLNLTNPVNATLSRATATATIVDAVAVVNTKPVVAANPVSQTLAPGQTATFTAAATGTPTPAVQWQVSTTGSTFVNIPGATSTAYPFTATSSESGYQFRAVFTNAAGTATTTAALLTVSTAPVATLPVVATNPVSQTVTAGQTATFTAAATGTPAPTVQWQVERQWRRLHQYFRRDLAHLCLHDGQPHSPATSIVPSLPTPQARRPRPRPP